MPKKFSKNNPPKNSNAGSKGGNAKRNPGPSKPRSQPSTKFSRATTLPSRALKFSSMDGGGVLRVSGVEYFTTVQCTSSLATRKFSINIRNGSLFPRLQSMGELFEQFSIVRLRLIYKPACPATRSGNIGVMIDYDASDTAPPSFLALLNNESANTGAVYTPITVDFKANSQSLRWFYSNNSDTLNSPTSSSERYEYPGVIYILTNNSSSGDSSAIAGYLSVEFDIAFKNMRPNPLSSVALSTNVAELTNASFGGALNCLSYVYNAATGVFDDTKDSTTATPVVGESSIPGNSALIQSIGSYVLDWLFSAGSEGSTSASIFGSKYSEPSLSLICGSSSSSESKSGSNSSSLIPPRPNLVRQVANSEREEKKADSKSDDPIVVVPKCISKTLSDPDYIEVWQDPATLIWWGLLPDGTWVVIPTNPPGSLSSRVQSPKTAASGDLYMALLSFDVQTGAYAVLDSSTTTANTSAVTYNKVISYTCATPQYLCVQAQMDYPADTRALNAFHLDSIQLTSSD